MKRFKVHISNQITIIIIFAVCVSGCKSQSGTFTIKDLGKEYTLDTKVLEPGLYYHIENDDDVIGGNTSIRNIDAANLEWKGNPKGNGFGYYQRNRDLGQVFTVPDNHNIKVKALVLRTSRGNNAVMDGASGSELNIVFFEVDTIAGQDFKINENGTTIGNRATHGFDHQFNRADDFVEGAKYTFLYYLSGGIFPEIPSTTQYVYDSGKGRDFGEQEGHLRYFRCDFSEDLEIILEGGKQYAFMVGFTKSGNDRGVALAIDSEVHTKEAAEFVKDANGSIRWGIRREGNGSLPPTMTKSKNPPLETDIHDKLVAESVFPENHFKTLTPTTNGFPDVDTYRTLQFYLEIDERSALKSE